MGIFDMFSKESIAIRKRNSKKLSSHEYGILNSKKVYKVIDAKGKDIVIQEFGEVAANSELVGTLNTTQHIKSTNGSLNKTKETVNKYVGLVLHRDNRIILQKIRHGEISEKAEEYIKMYLEPNFKYYSDNVINLGPNNKLTLERDIIEGVKKAIQFGNTAINSGSEYGLVGRFMDKGEVKKYLLITYYGMVGWYSKEDSMQLAKEKRLYKCIAANDGLSGTDGFQIKETLTITPETEEIYLMAFKQF